MAKQRTGVDNVSTQRVNVRLDASAYKRLKVHATMSRTTPGAILGDLIDQHLKRWSMPADLTARATTRVSASSSTGVDSVDMSQSIAG